MKCGYRRGKTNDIFRFHEFLETISIKEYNKGDILSVNVKKMNQSMQKKDLEANTILVRMTHEKYYQKILRTPKQKIHAPMTNTILPNRH